MSSHSNQDGSLEGAFAAAARDGSLEHRRAILKEWWDWNASAGAVDDIRPLFEDGLAVDLFFDEAIDARNFMNRLYDELLVRVKAEPQ
jgi:hypothetical protein